MSGSSNDLNTNVVLTANTQQYNQSMDSSAAKTNQMVDAVTKLSTGIDSLSKSAGRKLELFGGGGLAGLAGATLAASKYEEQLGRLHAQAALVGGDMGKMDQSIDKTRRTLGLTTTEATNLYGALSKMGQTQSSLGNLTKTFTQLSSVTGENVAGLASGMTSLQRTMGTQGVEQAKRYSMTLADLSANAGVSAQGVLDFSNNIAPLAKVAGMTQQQVMGVSTAFTKAGQDGYAAGNAFQTLLTGITQSVQSGSPDLAAYANLIGVSVDQFKDMAKNGQMSKIVSGMFDSFNKQGSNAIVTLQRFGLDGIRTYKALQAVAQQGGIGKYMDQATSDYQAPDADKYNKAVKESLGGLSHEASKAREEVKQVGEAFGAAFVPGVTKAIGAVNALLSPVTTLLKSLGAIPGAMGALGVAGTIGMGMVLKHFTGLSALSLGRGALNVGRQIVNRGPVGGFREGMASPIGPAPMGGAGGFGYRMGQRMAPLMPARNAEGERPSMLRTARGMVSTAGSMAIHGAGVFARGSLANLYPSAVMSGWRDPNGIYNVRQAASDTRTSPTFSGRVKGTAVGMAESAREGVRQASESGGSRIGGALRGMSQFSAAQAAAARASMEGASATRMAARETLAFGASLARAGAGTAMLGGRAGAGLLGRGVRGAGSVLGGIGSQVWGAVGPIGIALGGMYLNSKRNESLAQTSDMTNDAANAAINKYAAAIGQATVATDSFSDTLKKTVASISGVESPNSVTAKDVKSATQLSSDDERLITGRNSKYTNADISNYAPGDLKTYAQSILGSNPSAGEAKAMSLDILRRVGGDRKKAQGILDQATTSKNINFGSQFTNIDQQNGSIRSALNSNMMLGGAKNPFTGNRLFGFGDDSDSKHMSASVAQSANAYISGLGTDKDKARAALAIYNQGIQNTGSHGFSDSHAQALAAIIAPNDKSAQKSIQNQLMKATGKPGGFDAQKGILGGDYSGKDALGKQLSMLRQAAGSTYNANSTDLSSLNSINNVDSMASWNKAYSVYGGRDSGAARNFQGTMIGQLVSPSFKTGSDNPGYSALYDKQTSSAFLQAMNEPGNADAQAKSADMLADRLVKMTGSVAGATTQLEQMKKTAGSTSDPLYQLATNAEGAANKIGSLQTAGMTTAQKDTYVANQLQEADKHKNDGGDSYQRFMDARDAAQQQQEAVRQRNSQIVYGAREMNVQLSQSAQDFATQKQYSQEDFATSRKRSNIQQSQQVAYSKEDFGDSRAIQLRDYNLQRSRAEENYNIQRERSEQQFAIQRGRELQNYNLQRARAEQEFAIQRSRAQADYDLQRARAQQQYEISVYRANRDFNTQQARSLYEFNLSRKRQEEDYNHQVVIMAKDSAKQVYDIYQRVQVQQTQSIENLMQNMTDQNKRLADQQENLAKLRKMGLSNDAIQQLGLNDSQNSQQLARTVDELMNDPKMVDAFNKQIADRISKAGKLTADPANEQWAEMQRSFKLNLDRSQTDFNRQVDQNRADFRKSLADQRSDYNRQMSQGADDFHKSMTRNQQDFYRQEAQGATDFNRMRQQELDDNERIMRQQDYDFHKQMSQSQHDFYQQRDDQLVQFNKQLRRGADQYSQMMDWQNKDFEKQQDRTNRQYFLGIERMRDGFQRQYTEISGNFGQMAKMAVKALGDNATAQGKQANAAFKAVGIDADTFLNSMISKITKASGALGVEIKPISKAQVKHVNEQLSRYKQNYAEGGKVKGHSPHPKADNIPAMLTANEWVHSNEATSYYGDAFMERVNNKQFPVDIARRFANGGKVTGDGGEAPNRGPAQGMSWPWQWSVVHAHFPDAIMTSNYRPGAITAGGGQQSYHAIGRAIDVAGSETTMKNVGKWLLSNYGNASHDLLHSPLWGHMGIYEGKWYRQPESTYEQHFNHVHWGYKKNPPGKGAPQSNPAGYMGMGDAGGMTKAEYAAALANMPEFKFFSKAMAKSSVTGNAVSPWLENLVAQAADQSGALLGAGGMGGQAAPKDVRGAIALGKKMAAARGWTGRDWDALYNLWQGESNWNYKAYNDSSGATGIPQALPGIKMASAGQDWRTNPGTQIRWGLGYIGDRYGSPSQAYGQWMSRSPHWYANGTDNAAPGDNMVGENGAEIVMGPTLKRMVGGEGVLNSNTTSKVLGNALAAKQALLSAHSVPSSSANIVYNVRTDASTNFHGNISVEAKDPNEFIRKMKAQKRLAALTGSKR